MHAGTVDIEMLKSLGLILVAVIIGVSGQLSLKYGVNALDRMHFIFSALTSPYVIGGISLYAVGAAVWIVVLSRVPLSFAYPMQGGLTYIGVLAASALLLGETVPTIRWVGTLVILTGVVLVARSY